MSYNNVTMEMVGEELFKIVKADTVTKAAEAAMARVEAARLLLEIISRQKV